MSSRSQVSLFRISFEKVLIKIQQQADEKGISPQFPKSLEETIDFIVGDDGPKYAMKEMKIAPDVLTGDFSIRVFYKLISLEAKWTGFFKNIVDQKEDKFFSDLNAHKSFVGFLYNEKEIFCFCGGLGSHVVSDVVDDEFGISLLVRLLDKDNLELKRAINKALTGRELAADRFFKANHRIGNEENFGKIYKSIYTKFPKDLLIEELGLPEQERDRGSTVAARTYFQLGRSISFHELIRLVSSCEEILKREALFELNKIKQITGRKVGERELINKLFSHLIVNIFKSFKEENLDEFDLVYKDLESFIKCSEFYVRKGKKIFDPLEGATSLNLEQVFSVLSSDIKFVESVSLIDPSELSAEAEADKDSIEVLSQLLNSYYIEGVDFDGTTLFKAKLTSFIQAEVELGGATYFYLEDDWYKATDGFMDDVNEGCRQLIEESIVSDLLQYKWSQEDDENSYIEKYFADASGTIFPMHKVLYRGTELCDLLIKKSNAIYFVHIKQGFSSSVRDLISQVHLSAKLFVNEWKNNKLWRDKDFVAGYHKAITNMDPSTHYGALMRRRYSRFRKNTFADIFDNVLNFYFVFAVCDDAEVERLLPRDIKQFRSNIAKMSLINLEKDISILSPRASSLKFAQILRE